MIKNMEIVKKFINDFNWLHFDDPEYVGLSTVIDEIDSSKSVDVVIRSRYESENGSFFLTFKLVGVRNFDLSSSIGSSYITEIDETDFIDIRDRGWEKVTLEIENFGGGAGISGYCVDAKFIRIEKEISYGNREIIWEEE